MMRVAHWAGILFVLMALVVGAGTIGIRRPEVVTFDKASVVGKFVGQLSQHEVSDEIIRVKTNAFNQALMGSLDDYAKTHRVLILNQSDVLSEAHDVYDITDLILAQISARMRGHL